AVRQLPQGFPRMIGVFIDAVDGLANTLPHPATDDLFIRADYLGFGIGLGLRRGVHCRGGRRLGGGGDSWGRIACESRSGEGCERRENDDENLRHCPPPWCDRSECVGRRAGA